MTINITSCTKVNIVDSCALWNILSSLVFTSVLDEQKFDFSCTAFVYYECLQKPRTAISESDDLIKTRFKKLVDSGKIISHPLTIEDLQDTLILANRKSLGRGELSSVAFAKKIGLCFLTDDQGARKIATKILGANKVQTTPHLLGWLFFNGFLTDGDLEPIISEHKLARRPLEKFFRAVYSESWRIKAQLRSI